MMFGLTLREQRWKAEQQAAEVLFALVATTVKAAADIRVAEAQCDASVLKALRAEVAKMRQQLAARSLPDNAGGKPL